MSLRDEISWPLVVGVPTVVRSRSVIDPSVCCLLANPAYSRPLSCGGPAMGSDFILRCVRDSGLTDGDSTVIFDLV